MKFEDVLAQEIKVKDYLEHNPMLRYVFLELTQNCNLNCRHCGSNCGTDNCAQFLETSAICHVIDEITSNVSPRQTMFCVTGGEPLLHKDWECIGKYISDRSYHWGMTTNGTLVTEETVERMKTSGMKTISVSLDGLKKTHDWLRGVDGCYERAISGIRLLVKCNYFRCVQVTTVVHPGNMHELDTIYEILKSLGVHSWKLTGVEPIGKAKRNSALFLSSEQYKWLFEFILKKRNENRMEVTYGCSHFLPEAYDATVRKYHFLCGAGTMIASISSNGDILACLDIENRALTKQGNIYEEEFWPVWENRFELFRKGRENKSERCKECCYLNFCRGDSWHTWDFINSVPGFCMINYLEEK